MSSAAQILTLLAGQGAQQTKSFAPGASDPSVVGGGSFASELALQTEPSVVAANAEIGITLPFEDAIAKGLPFSLPTSELGAADTAAPSPGGSPPGSTTTPPEEAIDLAAIAGAGATPIPQQPIRLDPAAAPTAQNALPLGQPAGPADAALAGGALDPATADAARLEAVAALASAAPKAGTPASQASTPQPALPPAGDPPPAPARITPPLEPALQAATAMPSPGDAARATTEGALPGQIIAQFADGGRPIEWRPRSMADGRPTMALSSSATPTAPGLAATAASNGPMSIALQEQAAQPQPVLVTPAAAVPAAAQNPALPITEAAPIMIDSAGRLGEVSSAPTNPLTADALAAAHGKDAGEASRGQPRLPVDYVAVQVANAIRNGLRHITIQMRPPSLGEIDVELNVSRDGQIRAAFLVEKPETLELLQRDARGLERALQDAGLRSDSGSLSFGMRGEGQDSRSADGGRDNGVSRGSDDGGSEIEPDTASRPPRVGDHAIDISV